MTNTALTLQTLMGNYPNTAALLNGTVASSLVRFEFAKYKASYQGFKSLLQEHCFDFGEMAIVSYLQAKSYGLPYIMMPIVVVSRFQHPCLIYNAERGMLSAVQLAGKKIGVRSYTQTGVVWIRSILKEEHGVDWNAINWIAFEDGNQKEYTNPPNCVPAPAGKDMLRMLLDGELDAVIVGNDLPTDPRLQPVIPSPVDAALAWIKKHQTIQLNHLLVVRESISRSRPDIVRELARLMRDSKAGGPPASAVSFDANPVGIEAMRKSLEIVIATTFDQGLIPRRFAVDDLFDATTRAI